MNDNNKKSPFSIDREKRKKRRNALRRVERSYYRKHNEDGGTIEVQKVIEQSPERAESLSIVREMARAFADTMEFYKTDCGGAKPHDEAFKEALQRNEWRRGYVDGLEPEKVD